MSRILCISSTFFGVTNLLTITHESKQVKLDGTSDFNTVNIYHNLQNLYVCENIYTLGKIFCQQNFVHFVYFFYFQTLNY